MKDKDTAIVDIHTHILPGVDDGAGSVEETVEMLRMAHESGTRAIVATPHMFHPSFSNRSADEIRDRYEALLEDLTAIAKKASEEFLQDMEILLGAENHWGPDFLQAFSRQMILPIHKSRYLLLEFHPLIPRSQLVRGTETLLSEGLSPLLAHVERYSAVQKDPDLLQKLLDQGCLTQLNARSLEGRAWAKNRRFALRLLGAGLISVIASDAHGAKERNASLSAVADILTHRFPARQIQAWTIDSPRWVIESGWR